MKKFAFAFVMTIVAAATGCSREPDQGSKTEAPSAPPAKATAEAGDVAPQPDRAPAQAAAHAGKDVTPGSHEDWCGEHGVPESQCTRCNPELIAAFKATGDWCEEHGMPESQCLQCNPDLEIVRPPKTP